MEPMSDYKKKYVTKSSQECGVRRNFLRPKLGFQKVNTAA